MEKLLGAVKKSQSSGYTKEEGDVFYYPVRDSVGNGSAVIRFLPADNEDDAPFVKLYSHGFKSESGKWLIDNCLTTIDQECPVCLENSKRYQTMSKDDARKAGMNRKTHYVARILVVEDKKTPENENKVFMYKFGQKVFDKIVDKLQPEFEDDKPCNVFSLEEGANFKLKIRKVDDQVNYDKSEFEDPSECDLSEKKIFAMFNAENNPQKFMKPEQFKTFEKLQERLNFVMGKASNKKDADEAEEFEQVVKKSAEAEKPKSSRKVVESNDGDDEDDIMKLVKSLADEDVNQ